VRTISREKQISALFGFRQESGRISVENFARAASLNCRSSQGLAKLQFRETVFAGT
jgi:hypothetical protein